MNAVTPTSNVTALTPATSGSSAPSGDALALMRPSMDAAFTIGRPTDAAGAAGILAAGATYVQGAAATVMKLDEGIEQRTKLIERLQQTDPQAAKEQQGQLELLEKLRDRIQLSIDRVSDTLAGRDRDDIGTESDDTKRAHRVDQDADRAKRDALKDDAEQSRRKREELLMLEERRRVLAPANLDAISTMSTDRVASTYSSFATSPSVGAA